MADSSPEVAASSTLKTALKRIATALAITVPLAWVIWGAWGEARQIDLDQLHVRPGLIVISCGLLALALVWQALVWVGMMRALGYPLAWRPGVRAATLSQLGNYIPGKVFILVVRAQVAAQYGVPSVPVAGSVALETLLRNLMATILAGLGLYQIGIGRNYLWALLALGLMSVVFAQPRVFHAIGDWILRKLGRPPIPSRLTGPQVLVLLGCYLAYWAFYIAGFYLMLDGSFGTELTKLPALTTAVCGAQIASTLWAFAPAGLGGADLTMSGVLLLTGAAPDPKMVALVARVWRTVTEMAQVGMVALVTLPGSETSAETQALGIAADEAAGRSPHGAGRSD